MGCLLVFVSIVFNLFNLGKMFKPDVSDTFSVRISRARVKPLVDFGVSGCIDVPVVVERDEKRCFPADGQKAVFDRLHRLLAELPVPLVVQEAHGEPGAASLGALDIGLFDATCPVLDASFQQRLLRAQREDGVFPLCMHGAGCMGFDSNLKGRLKTPGRGGLRLIALMSKCEYKARAGSDCTWVAPPRPCLLCYRTTLFDLVMFLRSLTPESVAFQLDADVVFQTHRSLWDREGGFLSRFCFKPPVDRPLGLVTGMLRPCLLSLEWTEKESSGANPGYWYLDQSAIEWRAEDSGACLPLGSHFLG
jgi:hypothetical protein